MSSSDDDKCSLVRITEQETLGEARKRRALQVAEASDGGPALGKVKTGALASKSNTRGKSKAIKSPKGRGASKGKSKGRGRDKGKGKIPSERKSRSGRSTVTGLLGLPIHWDEEDCDYEDSEDETYEPTRSPSSPSDAFPTRTITKNSTLSSRKSCRKRASPATSTTRKGSRKGSKEGQQQQSRASLTGLSPEVALNSIVRPYLCAASKCALHRTCNDMRQLIDKPEAWQSLDLRASVIGRRTMRSGRQSILSNQPLFFLARSVIQQSRFSRIAAVDLRGLNLGAMGSAPDLLVTLFKTCSSLTKLNLWKTFVEDAALPQPDSAIEEVIADNLPGLEHLALEIDASNMGLKVLLHGCRRLKSLHIGSRCSSRMGNSMSIYPNNYGMFFFDRNGASCLETLTFVDKVNIGALGLRHVLRASSCPRLKSLILIRCTVITDRCLDEYIIPEMGRITSLTLDHCPIKPATVQMVLERLPQLSRLVVCTGNGVLENPQEGRPLLNMILARGSAKLISVDLQRAGDGVKGAGSAPPWLLEDAVLHRAVLDSHSPRIAIGFGETPDDRISPFMVLEPSKE